MNYKIINVDTLQARIDELENGLTQLRSQLEHGGNTILVKCIDELLKD